MYIFVVSDFTSLVYYLIQLRIIIIITICISQEKEIVIRLHMHQLFMVILICFGAEKKTINYISCEINVMNNKFCNNKNKQKIMHIISFVFNSKIAS